MHDDVRERYLRCAVAVVCVLSGCRGKPARDGGAAPAGAPPDAAVQVSAPAPGAPSAAVAPDRAAPAAGFLPPAMPRNLEASAGPSTVELTWLGPGDGAGVSGYEVYRGDLLVARTSMTMAREAGLEADREHCYTVRAFDAAGGRSPPSPPVCARTPDVTPPTAPEGLNASQSGSAEVALEWQGSTDDVGVAGYEVLRDEEVVSKVNGTRARAAGLAAARRYCFAVRAFDAAGNRSQGSKPACVTTRDLTPPTPPVQLTGEARPASLVLRWAPSTDDVGVAGYEVLRSGAVVSTVKGTTASEVGLRAAVEHCYTVRAFDAAGNRSDLAGPVCGTPPDVTPPSAPAELSGAAPSETEVALRWGPSTDDVGVAGYEVLRSDAVVARVTQPGASESGLRAATRYCYAVRAHDAAGNRSEPAGPVCVTTPDLTPPSAPAHLVATAESDREVGLRWDASTDNVEVVGYEVRRGPNSARRVSGTAASETALSPGRRYCYTVVALDAAGNVSAASETACATTPDLTPPTVPENVAAAPSSSTQVALAWSPSTDDVGVTAYELLRDGARVAKVSQPYAAVGGLAPLTEYCFTVRAHDAAGNRSEPSAPVCAQTADPSLPAGPTGLRARGGAEEIVLAWDPSPEPGVVYSVYWDKDKRIGVAPLTTFKVFGKAARERHCYRVSAQDAQNRESPKTLPLCIGLTKSASVR